MFVVSLSHADDVYICPQPVDNLHCADTCLSKLVVIIPVFSKGCQKIRGARFLMWYIGDYDVEAESN